MSAHFKNLATKCGRYKNCLYEAQQKTRTAFDPFLSLCCRLHSSSTAQQELTEESTWDMHFLQITERGERAWAHKSKGQELRSDSKFASRRHVVNMRYVVCSGVSVKCHTGSTTRSQNNFGGAVGLAHNKYYVGRARVAVVNHNALLLPSDMLAWATALNTWALTSWAVNAYNSLDCHHL